MGGGGPEVVFRNSSPDLSHLGETAGIRTCGGVTTRGNIQKHKIKEQTYVFTIHKHDFVGFG
jgi:hypothetical protein